MEAALKVYKRNKKRFMRSDATTIIVNVNYFLTSPRVSIGTYLNTFHLKVIRLGTAIAGMAGPLEDGDCLPRALTPGYVQPGDGKK